jgi:hypothetical protein
MQIREIRSHTASSLECIAIAVEYGRSTNCPLSSADACDVRRRTYRQSLERVVDTINSDPS